MVALTEVTSHSIDGECFVLSSTLDSQDEVLYQNRKRQIQNGHCKTLKQNSTHENVSIQLFFNLIYFFLILMFLYASISIYKCLNLN